MWEEQGGEKKPHSNRSGLKLLFQIGSGNTAELTEIFVYLGVFVVVVFFRFSARVVGRGRLIEEAVAEVSIGYHLKALTLSDPPQAKERNVCAVDESEIRAWGRSGKNLVSIVVFISVMQFLREILNMRAKKMFSIHWLGTNRRIAFDPFASLERTACFSTFLLT